MLEDDILDNADDHTLIYFYFGNLEYDFFKVRKKNCCRIYRKQKICLRKAKAKETFLHFSPGKADLPRKKDRQSLSTNDDALSANHDGLSADRKGDDLTSSPGRKCVGIDDRTFLIEADQSFGKNCVDIDDRTFLVEDDNKLVVEVCVGLHEDEKEKEAEKYPEPIGKIGMIFLTNMSILEFDSKKVLRVWNIFINLNFVVLQILCFRLPFLTMKCKKSFPMQKSLL